MPNRTFSKQEFVESAIFGVAGIIAFTIIGALVFILGILFNIKSLRGAFISEVVLIKNYPLFFTTVALIKILIGGELIFMTSKWLSNFLGIKIFVDRKKAKRM